MKSTEQDSLHQNLHQKTTKELLQSINEEDRKVAEVINACLDDIETVVEAIFPRMQAGGRLFYIGAGTSGRLGIVDASECPPTFGVDHNTVIGLIAGGDSAIRKAVEFAEDDSHQAWKDLQTYTISELDSVIGIAASGTTPYVIGGIEAARTFGCFTASISCNRDSELSRAAEQAIEAVVGPEFVTGSTRMKAGTAQKLILNMISTSLMIKLGRVFGNKMVDMQLSNNKLKHRAVDMLRSLSGIDQHQAQRLINEHGNVREALNHLKHESRS
ncbi:MAG: N-acetylmuramic acid 6-phosphate etherase [Flavobacteriales bacterium]